MVKVKAFSLFESVVAIAIISVCIGLGATIYSNVMSAEQPVLVLDGRAEMKRLLHEINDKKLYVSQSFSFEGYEIDQTLTAYRGNAAIYQVDFKMMVAGKMMAHEQHLVYNETK